MDGLGPGKLVAGPGKSGDNSRSEAGALMNDEIPTRVLSPHQRATIEAAAARIVPADEEPGALEAGVIEYIERLLAKDDVDAEVSVKEKKEYANFILGTMSGRTEKQQGALFKLQGMGSRHRQTYLDGVAKLDGLARELCGGESFCELNDAERDRVLSVLDERQDPFFALLVTHTMEGFYGHPRHGGNRDGVGWQVLGYPGPSFPRGNESPYGWYDANVPDEFPKKKGG